MRNLNKDDNLNMNNKSTYFFYNGCFFFCLCSAPVTEYKVNQSFVMLIGVQKGSGKIKNCTYFVIIIISFMQTIS